MNIDTAARGLVAGAIGAGVMALMMRKVAPHVVPEDMRPPEFVPRQVVQWAEALAGEPGLLDDRQERAAAYAAHAVYGGAMGALYGSARDSLLDGLPAPVAGALFGAGTWVIGFEGWMPALGVRPATTDNPPKRWPMPIMAHVVYGVSTALVHEMLGKATGHERTRQAPVQIVYH